MKKYFVCLLLISDKDGNCYRETVPATYKVGPLFIHKPKNPKYKNTRGIWSISHKSGYCIVTLRRSNLDIAVMKAMELIGAYDWSQSWYDKIIYDSKAEKVWRAFNQKNLSIVDLW